VHEGRQRGDRNERPLDVNAKFFYIPDKGGREGTEPRGIPTQEKERVKELGRSGLDYEKRETKNIEDRIPNPIA